jgi:neurotransmitter:Na+ symporter, NSS family
LSKVFSSRWGLILATLGMAIGTGNLWRFPRILAQNGGGTFLIPWAIFLFTWSIPLLMAEFAIGRASKRGPVGAFATVFGKRTAWRGGFVAFCTIAILFYYSVVSGWTLRYLWMALSGGLSEITVANADSVFLDFTKSWGPALTHLLSIAAACGVVVLGVTGGIERVCKILVPALFVVLIVSAVRGLSLEGASGGMDFLTSFDFDRLLSDHTVWLEALTQSAWSTGAGWGLMVCYAIYASRDMRTGRECISTGLGNNCASLLAALAIIPAVFALAPLAGQDPSALVQESGPASTGLTFVWMPVLFKEMPSGGGLLGTLFFAGLAFAALSSLIALVELAVRTLSDLGVSRGRATAMTFGVGFVLGLPSAVDLAFIPGHEGLTVFGNQDWVWGVGLMVSGALTGWSVLSYGTKRFYDELIAAPEGGSAGKGLLFRFAITVLVPLQALGLLGWWFYNSFTWVSNVDAEGVARPLADRVMEWLDPTTVFGLGTCLLQWGVVIAVLLFFNRRLAHVATAADGD